MTAAGVTGAGLLRRGVELQARRGRVPVRPRLRVLRARHQLRRVRPPRLQQVSQTIIIIFSTATLNVCVSQLVSPQMLKSQLKHSVSKVQ